ncbi:hypothetical protein Sru01_56190 [Sphaerisporangium rufum]|uniref:WD40 repeat domain-containing protein n=1 Tax=Sphaerisporangium rufum TaxID=1381558 RepID=A0A919V3B7_9ACTN|nr:hypothetical protein [Sphaerisporangium rufum]GII80637.1 hypothetical protein Sru01_56190 [Sphaerisporangium rufum]
MTPPIEDRLRDAFAAGADLVTPGSLRAEPSPVRGGPRGRRLALVVPLAAALLVALTSLVVTTAGRRTAPIPAGPIPAGPATAAPSVPPRPAPRFMMTADDDGVKIRDTRTGAVVTDVAPPVLPKHRRGDEYVVAGNGTGTLFYVARSGAKPGSRPTGRIYRIQVSERGKGFKWESDVVPPILGQVATMAVSADGTHLAYSVDGRIAVVDVATKVTRTWTTGLPYPIFDLSLTADGRTLALSDANKTWLLDVSGPGGLLSQARVLGIPTTMGGVAISPDGARVLAGPMRAPDALDYSIDEYATTGGGRRIRSVFAIRLHRTTGWLGVLQYDAGGSQALVRGIDRPFGVLSLTRGTLGPLGDLVDKPGPHALRAAW